MFINNKTKNSVQSKVQFMVHNKTQVNISVQITLLTSMYLLLVLPENCSLTECLPTEF